MTIMIIMINIITHEIEIIIFLIVFDFSLHSLFSLISYPDSHEIHFIPSHLLHLFIKLHSLHSLFEFK